MGEIWQITDSSPALPRRELPTSNLERILIPTDLYPDGPFPRLIKNWGAIRSLIGNGLHATIFRSKRWDLSLEEAGELNTFDNLALAAAKKKPGFKGYYRGERVLSAPAINETRRRGGKVGTVDCVSFCLFDSAEHAKIAANSTAHDAAKSRLKDWYETPPRIERYTISTEGNVITFEKLPS